MIRLRPAAARRTARTTAVAPMIALAATTAHTTQTTHARTTQSRRAASSSAAIPTRTLDVMAMAAAAAGLSVRKPAAIPAAARSRALQRAAPGMDAPAKFVQTSAQPRTRIPSRATVRSRALQRAAPGMDAPANFVQTSAQPRTRIPSRAAAHVRARMTSMGATKTGQGQNSRTAAPVDCLTTTVLAFRQCANAGRRHVTAVHGVAVDVTRCPQTRF